MTFIKERGLIGARPSKLEEELKGVKIKFSSKYPSLAHLSKQSRVVRGVPEKSCGSMLFPDESDKMVSVADYFWSKYQVKLDPNLPLLCTRRPDPNNEDPMKRSGVYFPMEICVIAGQQRKSRLEASDVQELLVSNCLRPNDRLKQTVDYADTVSKSSILSENGVKVDRDPIKVVGEGKSLVF